MVAIANGKVVITREQYRRRINAEKCSSFFSNNFPACAKNLGYFIEDDIFLSGW